MRFRLAQHAAAIGQHPPHQRLRSGAIGQKVLFDLRQRGYDHIQALSVAFHERFTSGRVISRLTSDVDTLTEVVWGALHGLIVLSRDGRLRAGLDADRIELLVAQFRTAASIGVR